MQSHSASRSISTLTSGNSSAIAFSANLKDTPKLNKTLGKRMAERKLEISKEGPLKRRRTKQAEIDALAAETVKVEERSEAVQSSSALAGPLYLSLTSSPPSSSQGSY